MPLNWKECDAGKQARIQENAEKSVLLHKQPLPPATSVTSLPKPDAWFSTVWIPPPTKSASEDMVLHNKEEMELLERLIRSGDGNYKW